MNPENETNPNQNPQPNTEDGATGSPATPGSTVQPSSQTPPQPQPQQPASGNVATPQAPNPNVTQPQQTARQEQTTQPAPQPNGNATPPNPQPPQPNQMSPQPPLGAEDGTKKLAGSVKKVVLALIAVSVIGGAVFLGLSFLGSSDLSEREVVTKPNYQIEIPVGWGSDSQAGVDFYTADINSDNNDVVLIVAVTSNALPPNSLSQLGDEYGGDWNAFGQDLVEVAASTSGQQAGFNLNSLELDKVDESDTLVSVFADGDATFDDGKEGNIRLRAVYDNNGNVGSIAVLSASTANVSSGDVEDILNSFEM